MLLAWKFIAAFPIVPFVVKLVLAVAALLLLPIHVFVVVLCDRKVLAEKSPIRTIARAYGRFKYLLILI